VWVIVVWIIVVRVGGGDTRLDNRNRPTFRRELKARYDEQLRALGVTTTDRLSLEESQSLSENVVKNLKRLELLADWWRTGRTQAAR